MTDDLLSSLDPPRADVERPVGTIEGAQDGLGAGLRVWCGLSGGWRDVGDRVGPLGGIMRHRGRLSVSLSFDLGPAPKIVAADSVDGAEP